MHLPTPCSAEAVLSCEASPLQASSGGAFLYDLSCYVKPIILVSNFIQNRKDSTVHRHESCNVRVRN